MFWLIGGDELAVAVAGWFSPAVLDAVDTQLTHRRWHGFTAWDLVMPLFLFMVGTSLPFAQAKRVASGAPLRSTYWRIARRVALLWIFGMIVQTKLLTQDQVIRWSCTATRFRPSRWAIWSLRSPCCTCHWRDKSLFAALLFGYWALLALVPFAGHAAGTLEPTINFPRYIDELVLGGFRRDHNFTWVVSSLGFAATVLLGSMSGHLLKGGWSAGRKLLMLIALGLACLGIGWLWSYWLPLNRHLWTSSMILWSGGWSFLLLALFYLAIDVAGFKRWAFFFVVIGANALLAYVFDQFFGRTFSDTLVWALGGLSSAKPLPVPYDEFARSLGEVGLLWVILWCLYRRRIFLKA